MTLTLCGQLLEYDLQDPDQSCYVKEPLAIPYKVMKKIPSVSTAKDTIKVSERRRCCNLIELTYLLMSRRHGNRNSKFKSYFILY